MNMWALLLLAVLVLGGAALIVVLLKGFDLLERWGYRKHHG